MEINLAIDCINPSAEEVVSTLHSFLSKNKWFNGKIYVIVPSPLHLTANASSDLSSIYPKVEILNLMNDPILSDSYKKNSSNLSSIHKLLVIKSLSIAEEKMLFVSSGCLFFKDVGQVLVPNSTKAAVNLSKELDLNMFYRSSSLNKDSLESIKSINWQEQSLLQIISSYLSVTSSSILGEKSSEFNDRVFMKRKLDLFSLHFIKFDTLRDNIKISTKVNRIWIQNKNLVSNLLKRPTFRAGRTIISSPVKHTLSNSKNQSPLEPSQPKASSNSPISRKNKVAPGPPHALSHSTLKPIVNVVIPAYGAEDYIEECLDSIVKQTKPVNRILLGIDNCEKTLNKVKQISHKYHNLEVYYGETNTGPYLVVNSLIQKIPSNEFFITFGADDVMHRNLIDQMSVDPTPKISRHDGVLFILKSDFDKVGGYRSWRCAADTDMVFRLRRKIGCVKRIPILYNRREHSNQLTKTSSNRSDLRKSYIKIINENEAAKVPQLYIEPQFSKLTKVEKAKKKITVNMATYPARQYSFKPCIRKMLEYEFIDCFRIYLNEFKSIPEDFPKDPRIEYLIGGPNIKDSGKFNWAYDNKNEYYFTVDDDLIYSREFFMEHVKLLDTYNGEIFVTIHGKRVPPIPKNFHDTLKPMYHCLKENTANVWVHIGGTGVMAFDNSKIKIPVDLFKTHGMCDLWIAQHSQKLRIPILCRKHPAQTVTAIDIENKDTLFEKRHEMWNDQIRILQSVVWKLNQK